jgi:GT2 family glycosyltransferase
MSSSQIGVVVIGRNEGDRLIRSLDSITQQSSTVVYVDSGSTDGSCEAAQTRGVEVVNLDLAVPFTAARARNAGFDRLLELDPTLPYVQFIDGDCEVVKGWLQAAQHILDTRPDVVVVCGRRRELSPMTSIYNRLCDIEWNTPIGEAKACGGDAMMRVTALKQVGGFNPMLIAGEEPELCVRLRQQGGKILRIDAEMTLHDARMTRFGQWWKRSLRAGHAFAEGAYLHGAPPEKHWVKESRGIWLWGVIVPVFILAVALVTRGWGLLLLVIYLVMVYRIYRYLNQTGQPSKDAWLYAVFCMLGKFPQAQGQLQFYLNRLRGQRSQLVEYNLITSQKTAL